MKRRPSGPAGNDHGFITMIVIMVLLVAAVIFLAYLRVAKAQK